MIMGDELRGSPRMMALAKRNQAIQTFLFDRLNEPFGMGVGIRRPIRRLDDAQPRVLQPRAHRLTPLGIPVADQHAKPTGIRRGEVPLDLPSPKSSGSSFVVASR